MAGARERLLAGCRGYLDFATRNPGVYRTIFYSGEQIRDLETPAERSRGEAGAGGYEILVRLLEELARVSGAGTTDPWDPVVVWSTLHGLAQLRIDAALRSLPQQEWTQAEDRVLRTIAAAIPLETLGHAEDHSRR